MGINKKQRDFFHELIRQREHCRSYQDLSKALGVSTRSIRNYCQFFEEYLFEMGISNVIKHTTAGITYAGTPEQTNQILSRIGESDFYEYHLSPDDRILAIVLILLDTTVPVTVMELCKTLYVSRATLLNDMEKVRLYFGTVSYFLQPKYQSRLQPGYHRITASGNHLHYLFSLFAGMEYIGK